MKQLKSHRLRPEHLTLMPSHLNAANSGRVVDVEHRLPLRNRLRLPRQRQAAPRLVDRNVVVQIVGRHRFRFLQRRSCCQLVGLFPVLSRSGIFSVWQPTAVEGLRLQQLRCFVLTLRFAVWFLFLVKRASGVLCFVILLLNRRGFSHLLTMSVLGLNNRLNRILFRRLP